MHVNHDITELDGILTYNGVHIAPDDHGEFSIAGGRLAFGVMFPRSSCRQSCAGVGKSLKRATTTSVGKRAIIDIIRSCTTRK